ncbi:MAG TPA: fused MFS/spermidine synthase [Opitutaceae bacterium]|nr:fused MFS/spermidine synthase [Opitutaceae bacterium]
MLILLLFFCSGATALVYEVIWSKYLALLFGSTIQAQTVVLAVFMGGLALGNKLFSRWADRVRRPLAIYGAAEMAVGIYAAAFAVLYRVADAVFVSLGGRLLDHSGWLLGLKGLLSAGLLGVPTVLMGGTLPVLAAWLEKHTPDAGRRSARFYSTNSLGAVCGAALAGFVLIPCLGLPATLQSAAWINIGIGAVALLAARSRLSAPPETAPANPETTASPASPALVRWGCLVVALSGAVSMGLEVLASRCLCLIVGSSLQAFAIMLMAFILGIGLGSAVIASPRYRLGPAGRTTVILLLFAGGFIGLLVFNIVNLVEFYRHARSGLSSTAMGYRYYQGFVAVMSFAVLGLPAAALGSVLPLWIRVVSDTSTLLGNRVGRLLTWNTVGAVVGVLLTGFVLMPGIGLRGSFSTLALVAVAAAFLAAWATRQRLAAGVAVAVAAALVLIAANGGEVWRYALSAGVFRVQENDASLVPITERLKVAHLLFYEDAADATVSVERDDLSPDFSELVLRINGKADASSHGDLSTQILLGQLPLMIRPDSREVFCFGLGSGITAGTTLGYPIDHLTVAENCAPVLRAARLFSAVNQGALTDPRVRIYDEDARTILKLSPQKYDAIISEPSNPWMVNVGSVFSAEFYRLAAGRLKPGGIMTQWFHTYEMDDATVDLVLRTFQSVFPAMEIWDAGGGDIILLGSDRPWNSDPEAFGRALALAGPRRDLAAIGLTTPEAVLARQLASQRTAFAVAGPGPVQRDDYPILEYAAPRAMFIDVGRQAQGLQRFDERTYQLFIAPLKKDLALGEMDDATLKAIFCSSFASVNPGLQRFIQLRVEGNVAPEPGLLSMPCIFRGSVEFAVYEPLAAQTNDIVRRLANAESMLENSPNQAQAVTEIKSALDAVRSYTPKTAGWSAAYYACLGSEVSLRLGNSADARAILLRGLQLEPGSPELNYLARIFRHEGVLSPGDAPPGLP